MTTVHFVLQGARAATISESSGRARMFLAAVSGGLVALGLVATASSVGTAFYAFGLVVLPTLAFVGLVTFERVRSRDRGLWIRPPHRSAVNRYAPKAPGRQGPGAATGWLANDRARDRVGG